MWEEKLKGKNQARPGKFQQASSNSKDVKHSKRTKFHDMGLGVDRHAPFYQLLEICNNITPLLTKTEGLAHYPLFRKTSQIG